MAMHLSARATRRALSTPRGGAPASSYCTKRNFLPSTPPLSLSSSIATSAPYLIAAPPKAAAPVSGPLLPMQGSCSAEAAPASMNAMGRAMVNWRRAAQYIMAASDLDQRTPTSAFGTRLRGSARGEQRQNSNPSHRPVLWLLTHRNDLGLF